MSITLAGMLVTFSGIAVVLAGIIVIPEEIGPFKYVVIAIGWVFIIVGIAVRIHGTDRMGAALRRLQQDDLQRRHRFHGTHLAPCVD